MTTHGLVDSRGRPIGVASDARVLVDAAGVASDARVLVDAAGAPIEPPPTALELHAGELAFVIAADLRDRFRGEPEIALAILALAASILIKVDGGSVDRFVASVRATEGTLEMAAVDAIAAQVLGVERRCRVCGCTDDDCSGCVERTGIPCTWVEDDLCSGCVPQGGLRGA